MYKKAYIQLLLKFYILNYLNFILNLQFDPLTLALSTLFYILSICFLFNLYKKQ